MEDPQSPTSKEASEEHPGIEEQARELINRVRTLLAQGDREHALAVFGQLHPADQAQLLVELNQEAQRDLLEALSPEVTAEIFEHLEPEEAAGVAEGLEARALSNILDEASPDVAADILRLLPEEQSEETLKAMEEAEEVVPLLQYPDDSAGGLMTSEFAAVRDDITAGNALDTLRILGPRAQDMSSVLVVDSQGTLVGSVSVTRLALSKMSSRVQEIMEPEVTSVTPETDREECAHLVERYRLNRLPVVAKTGRLIGVILVEDVVDVVEEEATEDMYRMASIAGERVFEPLSTSVRRRLPWLYINLATAFLAAGVISLFESTITKVVALAVFLPVVAGQGGISGTQTLTLVVRSLALGEIRERRGLHTLVRELLLGLVHGALVGLVVGLAAYLWKGNLMLGVVVGVAMLGNMVLAGLVGAGIPLLLRRFHMDPAVSSAVFVTTFTDVVGFLLFLGLAAILIDSLL